MHWPCPKSALKQASCRRSQLPPYIENQYFTAYKIGEALAARLAESGGPKIREIEAATNEIATLKSHTCKYLAEHAA